ncbi:MAG: dockerin type I domain-containing protein [Planctomycetota bacterium]|nr:dockerin type I domain-containing protein [Planctomycetota bacterium]
MFLELDVNRDGSVDATELAQRIRTVDGQGVDGVPDTFLDRWDLDGNGKVDPVELPAAAKRALGLP